MLLGASVDSLTAEKVRKLLWHPIPPADRVRTREIQRPRLLLEPHVLTRLNVRIPGYTVAFVRECRDREHRSANSDRAEQKVSQEELV